MTRLFLTAVFLLWCCLLVHADLVLGGQADDYAARKKEKMDRVSREMAKVRNEEILFYGKVVDLDGLPVEGAEVTMRVRVFGARSLSETFQVTKHVTDSEGRFETHGFGELLNLVDIVKDGYVYNYRRNPERSFWYGKHKKKQGRGYEPDHPAVFKLRKKAEPALVKNYGMTWGLHSGEFRMVDLYRLDIVKDEATLIAYSYASGFKEWHPDLKISIDGEPGQYRLTVEALDADSGLAPVDIDTLVEMTEAPEKGYRPQIVLPVVRGEAGVLRAYVKSAGGLFYSRIQLSYRHPSSRDRVEFRFNAGTNLEGKRDLEHGLYDQYREDVKAGKRKDLKRADLPL